MARASSRVTPAGVALPWDRALALNLLSDFTLSSGCIDGSGEVRGDQGSAMIKELQSGLLCVAKWIGFRSAGSNSSTILGRSKRRRYGRGIRGSWQEFDLAPHRWTACD